MYQCTDQGEILTWQWCRQRAGDHQTAIWRPVISTLLAIRPVVVQIYSFGPSSSHNHKIIWHERQLGILTLWLFVNSYFCLWQEINQESSSHLHLYIFFPQRNTMFTCAARSRLGGPAKSTANGPDWTGWAQIGLLYGTLFFPLQRISLLWNDRPDNAAISSFLMSSQTFWIALLFPQRDSVSSFCISYNKNNPTPPKKKQANKKLKNTPSLRKLNCHRIWRQKVHDAMLLL